MRTVSSAAPAFWMFSALFRFWKSNWRPKALTLHIPTLLNSINEKRKRKFFRWRTFFSSFTMFGGNCQLLPLKGMDFWNFSLLLTELPRSAYDGRGAKCGHQIESVCVCVCVFVEMVNFAWLLLYLFRFGHLLMTMPKQVLTTDK